MDDTNFVLKDWLQTSGLTDETKSVLEDQQLSTRQAIAAITEQCYVTTLARWRLGGGWKNMV